MTEEQYFTANETERVIKHFGLESYEKAIRNIKVYSDKWALSSIKFIPSYSSNLLFTCYSRKYGKAILKFCNSSLTEMKSEYDTLLQYKGQRYCKVYAADIESGVMLEELIESGNPLRKQNSLEKRIAIFSSLYRNLHVQPNEINNYSTYTDWVKNITEYMSHRLDCKEMYLLMKKAYKIYLEITTIYSQEMLLHGDLHHDNILIEENGEYKIIDPKGVIGDPIFDIPRFILNEFDEIISSETYKKINRVISLLSIQLNIPNQILSKCLYIETAMGMCWCIEDGSTVEEYPELLERVRFAEEIMNTQEVLLVGQHQKD